MAVFSDTPVVAGDIIKRALRLMAQIGAGIAPTTDEYADGLLALNGLLDSLRNEKLICYTTRDQSFPMVIGQSSYTIGTGGNFNTERPVRIDGAYVIDSGGVSHPVTQITDLMYGGIPLKTNPGPWPNRFWYEPGVPLGTLNFYPVPQSDCTIVLYTWTPLQSFASITDSQTLPPGWFDMLCYNLAVVWAPEFERNVLETVAMKARETKGFIKKLNNVTPVCDYDAALYNGGGYINWRSGEAF